MYLSVFRDPEEIVISETELQTVFYQSESESRSVVSNFLQPHG